MSCRLVLCVWCHTHPDPNSPGPPGPTWSLPGTSSFPLGNGSSLEPQTQERQGVALSKAWAWVGRMLNKEAPHPNASHPVSCDPTGITDQTACISVIYISNNIILWLVISTTWGLKGHSVRKGENHCSRETMKQARGGLYSNSFTKVYPGSWEPPAFSQILGGAQSDFTYRVRR